MCCRAGKDHPPGAGLASVHGWVLRVQAVRQDWKSHLCRSHLAHADPAALPGHGEEHIPHELLVIAVKILHILPRAHPLCSSTQHSLALEQPRTWSQACCPAQLSWLPSSCFSPSGLSFGQGPSPWGCTASQCPAPYPAPKEPVGAVHFPAAAGEQQGLVGPQILPWRLPWDGRRSEWPEEEGSSWVGKGREALAIVLACPLEEKNLIKSRCSIQGCYSFPILLACLILLNLFKAFQKQHVIPNI